MDMVWPFVFLIDSLLGRRQSSPCMQRIRMGLDYRQVWNHARQGYKCTGQKGWAFEKPLPFPAKYT